jgi:hypothetical protein
VLGEGVRFFSVVSCPGSLWYPKWWKRFGDLFDFLGYLPQRIIGEVCWSEALQEVCMLSFSLVLSCLSSHVALLSSRLLSGVWNRCQVLRSHRFSSIFCFTLIGQSRVVSISVCSRVEFQCAHFIMSLGNLIAASIFSSVSRITFIVSF